MKKVISYILISIAIVSLLYIFQSEPKANMTVLDSSKEEVGSTKVLVSKFNQNMFSLFGKDIDNSVISLMSTVPATPSSPFAVFQTNIECPKKGNCIVIKVDVLKNGVQIDREYINQEIKDDNEIIYTTKDIIILGKNAKRNNVTLVVEFEQNQEKVIQEFQFIYLTLEPCTSDEDCILNPNIKCDFGNLAGFSTSPDLHYCASPCISSNQCPKDQICKRGVCGY